MRIVVLVLLIAFATPRDGMGQQAYVPSGELGPGTELVVVFIASSTCVANGDSAFLAAVPRMMASVGAEARRHAMNPVIVGVAMDNDVGAGVGYLASFGSFDEISVGRDWGNSVVIDQVWGDFEGPPMIPQVVVLTRDVRAADKGRIAFDKERIIERLVGPDAIRAWTEAGTPVQVAGD